MTINRFSHFHHSFLTIFVASKLNKGMKKNLIITLLFILTYGSANSQSFLGVRSSFNISSLTTREAKSRPGFNLGVMYSTPISHSWHFQPALLYNLSGSKSATNFKPH